MPKPLDAALRCNPEASERLRTIAAIAVAAGTTARAALQRHGLEEMVLKGPRDYQTAADVAVERQIVAAIGEAFPSYAIWGEEAVGNRAAADVPRVLIDPIDGTTNFAWGIPHYSNVISIEEHGEIVAGVLYDPMQDELFSAETGDGAWLNGARLSVPPGRAPQDSLVGVGLPVPGQVRSVGVEQYHGTLRRLMDTTSGVRRLGSAALSLAYVACGRLDGFFEDGLSPLDYGASVLLIREAGGLVTGFDGGPIPATGAILGAGRLLHPWLVEGFKPARLGLHASLHQVRPDRPW
jgi:myo-inositol-1(or 4)-monophosphatase